MVSLELEVIHNVYLYPLYQICLWWIERFRFFGHYWPMYATGNHETERDIYGQVLVQLALYCVVHPKAPISHARAFLFNMDPTVALYCPSAAIRAKEHIGESISTNETCSRIGIIPTVRLV